MVCRYQCHINTNVIPMTIPFPFPIPKPILISNCTLNSIDPIHINNNISLLLPPLMNNSRSLSLATPRNTYSTAKKNFAKVDWTRRKKEEKQSSHFPSSVKSPILPNLHLCDTIRRPKGYQGKKNRQSPIASRCQQGEFDSATQMQHERPKERMGSNSADN